jgi:hypothetical protein
VITSLRALATPFDAYWVAGVQAAADLDVGEVPGWKFTPAIMTDIYQ